MLSIPIGLLFSTTGPYDVVGRAMLNGAMVAVEEVNRSSTIRLQVTHADPGGDLARYEPLCREILDTGIRHVVGCYTSSSRKELIPLVEKRDALLWYPSHYEGFESAPNVVYTGAAPNQHIVPLIGHILQQQGRRVFCIGSNYIWAWENNRILREVLVPRGGTIVGERYLPVGDDGFAQAIEAILDASADFVFSTLIGTLRVPFLLEVPRGLRRPRHRPGAHDPGVELQSVGAGTPRDRTRRPLRPCQLQRLFRLHRYRGKSSLRQRLCRPGRGGCRRVCRCGGVVYRSPAAGPRVRGGRHRRDRRGRARRGSPEPAGAAGHRPAGSSDHACVADPAHRPIECAGRLRHPVRGDKPRSSPTPTWCAACRSWNRRRRLA